MNEQTVTFNGKTYRYVIKDRYSYKQGCPLLDLAGYNPTFQITIPSPTTGGEDTMIYKMVILEEVREE